MRAGDRPVPDGDDDAAEVTAAPSPGSPPANGGRLDQPTYAPICMDTGSVCPQRRLVRINSHRSAVGITIRNHRERRKYENSGNGQFRAPAFHARIGGRRPAIHVRIRHGRHDRRLCCGGRLAGLRAARPGTRPGRRLGPWPRWGGVGAAVGIGVGAAIIGGAIAASAAEQQRQQAVGYCMQRYRSYDPNSQTYLGRDGMRYSCP